MPTEAPTWTITLSDVDMGREEHDAVLEVLRSKWLSMGPVTARFEGRFARATGAEHAVAVNNGTAALHLALLAVGVEPGDEVIVPALTFVATANAVLYCGATPVFADIESPGSLVMDPEDAERKLTDRTRAIVPMHYGGYPCDMDALLDLARARGVRVVEDAAHAPGARYGDRPIGSIGDATCFSFFSNKNLVAGEGGMVTTDSAEIAADLRSRRSHGMTALSYDKAKGHAFSYDVVSAGYNYRITEINSALGLAQLDRLERNNATRRGLIDEYQRRLRDVDGLVVPFLDRQASSACHLQVVLLPEGVDRRHVQRSLKDRGIQTSVHYPPVHRFTQYARNFEATVPRVDAIAERIVTLPLHPLLSLEDVATVCDALKDALRSG